MTSRQPSVTDLITYLLCSSPEPAQIISELVARNPGMADLLMDIEADDDMRARLEVELLSEAAGDGSS